MAKKTAKKAPRKKTATTGARRTSGAATSGGGGDGKHLVIVESPAKARTINRYLGRDYVVKASVGHVRDLPKRNPKGVKAPVPGVDVEHGFQPTYEVITGKGKTVTDLKREAKKAQDVWLATDLDREGEAIAWHLAEALNVDPHKLRRVVFNAITKDEIRRAFEHPRGIDMPKVNAQQARRILDRIVGYQVSPLLWKKVAGGLSAGRVQSVAVRLIVEREQEIDAFTPEEYWKIAGYFAVDLDKADELARQWRRWLEDAPVKTTAAGTELPPGRTIREKNAWLSRHQCISAELHEVDGKRVELGDEQQALEAAQLAGFALADRREKKDEKAKGPARRKITLRGDLGEQRDWRVREIQTKRTTSRPSPPFITSTLQQAAANQLGFSAHGTMRTAQSLYEGVDVRGVGSVGLITYMRTDSTYVSNEAIAMARSHIERLGSAYLPDKPNFYRSSNKAAQEAHEAIRPTDVELTPDSPAVKASLSDQQLKLYRLIWNRFVASQMTPAQWDSTAVLLGARVDSRDIVFRTTGRKLVFDGFYRVMGVPRLSDELVLPELTEQQRLAAMQVDPAQHFTSPPPRYTEASLVKKLELEGIGRPSTYASIIQVIQDRKYVEKISGRFHATDLGEVVTRKLTEAFPHIMDIGYTRKMESELDAVEEENRDWVQMLRQFYGPFREDLEQAYEGMAHAKAETVPAPYECPECGAETMYRFGKAGRFLSCTRYPECKYAAPVDREGKPQQPEATDVACPKCSAAMLLRKGRFGPFLSCSRYPDCDGILNLDRKGAVTPPKVPPLETDLPCPKCEAPLNLRRSKRGPWLSCSKFPKCRGRLGWTKLDEETQQKWDQALEQHERQHPQPKIFTTDGREIPEDYKPRLLTGGDDEASGDGDYDVNAA